MMCPECIVCHHCGRDLCMSEPGTVNFCDCHGQSYCLGCWGDCEDDE